MFRSREKILLFCFIVVLVGCLVVGGNFEIRGGVYWVSGLGVVRFI